VNTEFKPSPILALTLATIASGAIAIQSPEAIAHAPKYHQRSERESNPSISPQPASQKGSEPSQDPTATVANPHSPQTQQGNLHPGWKESVLGLLFGGYGLLAWLKQHLHQP
jgi:hypothetical protein